MKKNNPKILFIEDDRAIARAIEFRLTQESYKLILARDGEEGLAKAEKHHPDLILLDIILPKMNGLEVLKKLKEQEKTKAIDVVIFSNLSQREDIKKAEKYGVVGYYVKSDLSTDELTNIINNYFNQKH